MTGGHDFRPEDFEPGVIHRLKQDQRLFGPEMAPAIAMYNPKYPHNVGAAVRAASCLGAKTVVFSGKRVPNEGEKGKYRIPREERMKGYNDVTILNDDYFFNRFSDAIVPVAVEVRNTSESLPLFEHPKHALYVFGPEDSSIPPAMLRHCHRFVIIPSVHCLNLGNAINVVLYDRLFKLGITSREEIKERRIGRA